MKTIQITVAISVSPGLEKQTDQNRQAPRPCEECR